MGDIVIGYDREVKMGSTAITVLAPGEKTLDELAAIANRKHEIVFAKMAAVFTDVVECGLVLYEARQRIGGSEWRDWVRSNLKFGHTTVSSYMRFAVYKDQLPEELFQVWADEQGTLRVPTLNRALPYLNGMPPLFPSGRQPIPDATRREARRLRAQGMTYEDIGGLLGMAKTTVRTICDPDAHRRSREATKRYLRRARAARRALAEQERLAIRDRAAKLSGAAVAETYALIRQAASEAHKAMLQADSPEARAAIRDTLTHIHQAEDAIAKALKVPRT